MSTQAQINANRENSKKSTGPRTPEGKAISSRNAEQHGTSSRFHELIYRDRPAYARLAKAFIADLKPVGTFEESLVETIIDNQWQINRCRARNEMEACGLAGGTRNMNELIRYEKRLEDSTRKAEAALRARQKFRFAEDLYKDITGYEIKVRHPYKPQQNGHFKRKIGFVLKDNLLMLYYDLLEQETTPKPEEKPDPPGKVEIFIG
jgi:hypothetical protein